MTQILQPKVRQKIFIVGKNQADKFTWENTAKSIMNVFDKNLVK